MIDWTQKRPEQIGVVVEGRDDQIVLEAFLAAGETLDLWGSWEAKLYFAAAGGFNSLLTEMSSAANRIDVVGIADQEWRTTSEIEEYEAEYPQLRFLPRRMIDNFFIDPEDLRLLIPKKQRDSVDFEVLKAEIENARIEWIPHGALSYTMHNRGAHEFCRGERGFPKRLLNKPETDQRVIRAALQGWHNQLEPNAIMDEYTRTIGLFSAESRDMQYQHCIDGKRFFESVVHHQMNQVFRQQDRNTWIDELFTRSTPSFCPNDLQPLLKQLMP